jgi:hypothetical protein
MSVVRRRGQWPEPQAPTNSVARLIGPGTPPGSMRVSG